MARVVFMGTPDFAVPSLRALVAQHTVAGVVTQPDRPAGRGRQLVAPPVKLWARQAGLPVIQPGRLREPEAMAQLRAWAPDLIVVAAFGQILKPEVLDLPAHGCLNVHASWLPRHRGAAPVAAAIAAGDAVTGVTLMQMNAGLDTGPILAQAPIEIGPQATTGTLTERLADAGARLLLDSLSAYLAGQLAPRPQVEALATYAPQLKKEDGHLDFTSPAAALERRVRAFDPWPGAFAFWTEAGGREPRKLRVLKAAVQEPGTLPDQPGLVFDAPDGPAVACRPGALLLIDVQLEGKRPMTAGAFARGARGFVGSTLR